MNFRPNVLLVVFDSLSASRLDVLKESLPTVNALQKSSVVFTNAYVSSPESSPARATLFTGLDLAAHRLWSDGVLLPEREKTLSQRFANNGYDTWLIGRRQLAGVSNWTTEHARLREYHRVHWAHGPLHRSRQNAYLEWLQNSATDTYKKIFPVQANPDDTRIPVWQKKAIADLPDDFSFNAWIGQQFNLCLKERRDDHPFMAVAGFVVGESMGAPDPDKLCVEALNERALLQADTALAAMLEKLPDNTIVIVTAGRGNMPQGKWPQCMHNEAIKVPLMISAPQWPANTVDEIVSTMDIAPTLFNATQMSTPKRIQGRCLFTTAPRAWSLSRLRSPHLPHQSALCTQEWKLVINHEVTMTEGTPSYQLYNLMLDNTESDNLAGVAAHQDNLEAMIDLMIDTRVALEDRTEPRIAKF
ncbi:MAG: sulfatase [Granulosicoccus sp.]